MFLNVIGQKATQLKETPTGATLGIRLAKD
jgi:hypothetical protein